MQQGLQPRSTITLGGPREEGGQRLCFVCCHTLELKRQSLLPDGLGRLPCMEASSCRGNSKTHFQSRVKKKLVKVNIGISKHTLRTILLPP